MASAPGPTRFTLQPIDEKAARAICSWRYPEPYDVYNGSSAAVEHLLNPNNAYHSVVDDRGDLIGFFCFGADARVPGEIEQDDSGTGGVLDVGLGMRPDYTGRGLGLEFVQAGLSFAREAFAPGRFRLAVLTFNQRAIRVYQKAGFVPRRVLTTETTRGRRDFLVMERPA